MKALKGVQRRTRKIIVLLTFTALYQFVVRLAIILFGSNALENESEVLKKKEIHNLIKKSNTTLTDKYKNVISRNQLIISSRIMNGQTLCLFQLIPFIILFYTSFNGSVHTCLSLFINGK